MLLRLILIFIILAAPPVHAKKRLALLIGNQNYKLNRLDLENPHNDVKAVGAALRQVGFSVRIVKDAGFGRIQKEINRYAKRLRRTGNGAVGFFYYSGHGALNDQDRFNYLIPTDVETDDNADLWDSSIRLNRIVSDLKDKAANAVHFVVFDACRNELKLSSTGTRSLTQAKGFSPIRDVRGMLIAYATAEGETASDRGRGAGPYAKALSKWITTPSIEAVTMFRRVQIDVFNSIGQEPWYRHGALRQVYLAGQEAQKPAGASPIQAPLSPAARDWQSVKDTKNPAALRAFARRYKGTVFADMALAMAKDIGGKPTLSIPKEEKQHLGPQQARPPGKAKRKASVAPNGFTVCETTQQTDAQQRTGKRAFSQFEAGRKLCLEEKVAVKIKGNFEFMGSITAHDCGQNGKLGSPFSVFPYHVRCP